MAPSVISTGLLQPGSHGPALPDRRQARRSIRSSASATQDNPTRDTAPLIHLPPPKPMQPMPEPIQVIHSPAYLYEMRSSELSVLSGEDAQPESSPDFSEKSQPVSWQEFNGTPLEWALSRADESLNEMERNPNEATLALWRASQSPVGEAAAAGVRGAAELTLNAGTKAVKIAAPVGLWAVREGFKAAFGLLSIVASESKKSRRRKKRLELEQANMRDGEEIKGSQEEVATHSQEDHVVKEGEEEPVELR